MRNGDPPHGTKPLGGGARGFERGGEGQYSTVANLVLGPLLRGAPETMTVWVEVDAPCAVEVAGRRADTFCVGGHHYALVDLAGLPPGTDLAYDVRLDGERVWPPGEWPDPPRLRTWDGREPFRVVIGSCRQSAPHGHPWDAAEVDHDEGMGPDALLTLADQCFAGERPWPHLLVMGGDQVYADEPHHCTADAVERRRNGPTPTDRPPVNTFEEYTWLYQETWRDPRLQRLMASVPSVMIFDDHDVIDDWNTSAAWHRTISRYPWWTSRVRSALMAYWVYQHIGNVPMAELAGDDVFRAVQDADDGEEALWALATSAEAGTPGRGGDRWSYACRSGPCRVLVVDSRNGRILDEDRRSMLGDADWRWLEDQLKAATEHVVLVSSVPWLLPPALHRLEALNEAVTRGAWGRLAARAAEHVRQTVDLEQWAAFGDSVERLARLLEDANRGRWGAPPRSLAVVSGDLHFGYVAELELDGTRNVVQLVTSPLRQASEMVERKVQRWAIKRPVAFVLGRLLRLAPPRDRSPYRWTMTDGPWFDNNVATLTFAGDEARVVVERAFLDETGEAVLRPLLQRTL